MATFKEALLQNPKSDSNHHQPQELGAEDLETNFFPQMQDGTTADSEDESLPNINEVELYNCDKLKNLYLIRKMIGYSVPLKTIMLKSKTDWMHTRENM